MSEKLKNNKLEIEVDQLTMEIGGLKNLMNNLHYDKSNLETKISFLNRIVDNEKARNVQLIEDFTKITIKNEQIQREYDSLSEVYNEILTNYNFNLNRQKDEFALQIRDTLKNLQLSTPTIEFENLMGHFQRQKGKFEETENDLESLKIKH